MLPSKNNERSEQGLPAPGGASVPAIRPIPAPVLDRWQGLLDTLTEIIGVADARIVRIDGTDLEILVTARTPRNPYDRGERIPFADSGLYCEHVLRSRACLWVRDSSTEPQSHASADAGHGMVSYLGYPIAQADGSLFGTICILDRVPRTYTRRAAGVWPNSSATSSRTPWPRALTRAVQPHPKTSQPRSPPQHNAPRSS